MKTVFIFLFFVITRLQAQSFPIATTQPESRIVVDSLQAKFKRYQDFMVAKQMPAKPLEFLQVKAVEDAAALRAENEALRGPFTWCSNGTTRQVCTYRIENLSDDSVSGMVQRFVFRKNAGKWALESVVKAHRCGRGNANKRNRYHNQTCQ